MEETVRVKEIIDEFARHGHSDKTNKDWAMARVAFDTGETGFVFTPVKVGDAYTKVQRNGYTNYDKVTPLQLLEARVARIEAKLGTNTASAENPATGPDIARQRLDEYKASQEDIPY